MHLSSNPGSCRNLSFQGCTRSIRPSVLPTKSHISKEFAACAAYSYKLGLQVTFDCQCTFWTSIHALHHHCTALRYALGISGSGLYSYHNDIFIWHTWRTCPTQRGHALCHASLYHSGYILSIYFVVMILLFDMQICILGFGKEKSTCHIDKCFTSHI